MGIFDIFRRKPAPVVVRQISRRNYAAAAKGRLFADFTGSARSADSEVRWALPELRNRSRDLERNNEYFRRYLTLLETNVVGEQGIRLQLKARNPDGKLDVGGNNIIERAWGEFARVGGPTIDGRSSLIDLQNLVIRGLARDGEVFLRWLHNPMFRHGLALEIIEPERIDEKHNDTLKSGNQVRMGVELDANTRRPVAYSVLTTNPGDYDYVTVGNVKRARIPAEEIIHVYKRDRAEQTRGVPWSAAAIASLKMLHGYREAELVAARAGASKMGFFITQNGDQFPADDYEDVSTPIIDAEAGTFHQLPKGVVDFKPFDPTHPTSAFAEFEKAILRGISGGLGVSYTALANDLQGTSYSSIRQGALEERDFYRTLQRFMIEQFMDPVFRVWLEHVMDFGLIPISGPGKLEKFTAGISWRARGFQWVDPLKEINAAVVGLQNGILSHGDIAANYGRDSEETFAQIQRDMEVAKLYGLTMAYQPFGEKTGIAPDIDDDDEVE